MLTTVSNIPPRAQNNLIENTDAVRLLMGDISERYVTPIEYLVRRMLLLERP